MNKRTNEDNAIPMSPLQLCWLTEYSSHQDDFANELSPSSITVEPISGFKWQVKLDASTTMWHRLVMDMQFLIPAKSSLHSGTTFPHFKAGPLSVHWIFNVHTLMDTDVENFLLMPLLLTWISNHMPSKVWDEIAYPFPNFNWSLGMDM